MTDINYSNIQVIRIPKDHKDTRLGIPHKAIIDGTEIYIWTQLPITNCSQLSDTLFNVFYDAGTDIVVTTLGDQDFHGILSKINEDNVKRRLANL